MDPIMENRKRAPMSLKIIAVVFFLSGAWALFDFLSHLGSNNNYIFNLGILGMPIAWGLMNYRAGWRTCALVFLWFAFIVLAVFPLFILLSPPESIFVFWNGKRIEPTMNVRLIACSLVIPFFLLTFWMYRVLTGPDVRALFGLNASPSRTTTDKVETHTTKD